MQVPAEDDNDDDFEKRYNMDAYDDEEEDNTAGGLDGLMAHADPRDDKYLRNPDEDDDQSDIEDNIIKPDDNLLLVGHVDGDASILEVYGKTKLLIIREKRLKYPAKFLGLSCKF